jgi:type I restriction enzyme R subunit
MTPLPRGVGGPEREARARIDGALGQAGWGVHERSEINLSAGRGIAVREYPMKAEHGFADYLLCRISGAGPA